MTAQPSLKGALSWRRVASCVAAFDALAMAVLILVGVDRSPWLEPGNVGGFVAENSASVIGLALITVGSLWAFERGPHRSMLGWLALVCLALLNQGFGEVHGTYGASLHHGGVCLFGYLLGRLGGGADEHLAEHALLGAFSATYFVAFLAKWNAEGASWMEGGHLQLILLSELDPLAQDWISELRRRVAESEALCDLLARFTLIIEGLAPLMVLHRSLRRVICLCLLGMHAGIAALLGYVFMQAIVLCAAFSMLPVWIDGQRRESNRRRLLVWSVCLLCACAALLFGDFTPRGLPLER